MSKLIRALTLSAATALLISPLNPFSIEIAKADFHGGDEGGESGDGDEGGEGGDGGSGGIMEKGRKVTMAEATV